MFRNEKIVIFVFCICECPDRSFLYWTFLGDKAAYRDEIIKHGGIFHLLSHLRIPDLSIFTVSFIHDSLFMMPSTFVVYCFHITEHMTFVLLTLLYQFN